MHLFNKVAHNVQPSCLEMRLTVTFLGVCPLTGNLESVFSAYREMRNTSFVLPSLIIALYACFDEMNILSHLLSDILLYNARIYSICLIFCLVDGL